MKLHYNVEKPRQFRKYPAAFFLLVTQGLLLVGQTACATTATTSVAPVEAPVVTFIQPRVDTVFAPGETLIFAISIRSHHELVSVYADVRGAMNYQFPAANPADTVFSTVFRVAAGGVEGDSLTLTVTATDILGNRGTGARSIALR